jgi:hypothetical protein
LARAGASAAKKIVILAGKSQKSQLFKDAETVIAIRTLTGHWKNPLPVTVELGECIGTPAPAPCLTHL